MRIASLLEREPQAAARAAAGILRSSPGQPTALLLLGAAHRACGDPQAAAAEFAELAAAQPDSAVVRLELGRALRAAGRESEALVAFEGAVELSPDLAEGWRELSLLHAARGEALACDAAWARFEELSPEGARLREATQALANQRYAVAEELLRQALAQAPQDVTALRLLAQTMSARENYPEAERLLTECLGWRPATAARASTWSGSSTRSRRVSRCWRTSSVCWLRTPATRLTARSRASPAACSVAPTARSMIFAGLAREFPASEAMWLDYGHTLRTAGRGADAAAAYRRCLALKPGFASAWVALANLKTLRFTPQDVEAMQAELTRTGLPDDERAELEFALAKALEDAGDFGASFEHYSRGNALRRARVAYRAESLTQLVERSRALYTREFFAARSGWGCPAVDPIFIVGLPRAGSTLIEQILASHSQVEGTRELGDVAQFAVQLGHSRGESDQPPRYPHSVAALTRAELTALGERYLAQTRAQRLQGRPRFIDKMGGNFLHLGLIHLMLPNARIIDARRAPLGCCVANFKQHFYLGGLFTYSLEDLGRYYRDYVRLMAHFDAVLPGRVHRVSYENVVRDLEGEVRRLLEYCGLPFEEQCLRFHETRRAVQTVSSEQVRQPLYTDAVEQWRNFEPWLGPLRQALGELAATPPDSVSG